MFLSRFAESRKASPGRFCVSETEIPGQPHLDKEERRGLALDGGDGVHDIQDAEESTMELGLE